MINLDEVRASKAIMDRIYTSQDHERISEIYMTIIQDNVMLPDEEFCVLALNIIINAVMRIPKDGRHRAIDQMMSCVKRLIVNP